MTEENLENVPEQQIEEIKEEVQEDVKEVKEESIKRGRGRPKGALGKKNITRHSEQEQEKRNVEDFILDVSFDEPKPSRKRVKKIKEEEEEELSPVPLTPMPKKKVAMKKTLPEEPLTYLEVLTRGLRAAESQHKAHKVATYDNFFRY